jgi:hypothetical protein
MSKLPVKRPRGRPTKYTPELAEEICRRLREGESLRSICRTEGYPRESAVIEWAKENRDGFSEQYAQARDVGLDRMAEETLEIADDGSNDWMARNDPENAGYIANGEHVARSRLRVDTRKWYLSKLAPKRYGDRLAVDASVENKGQENIDVVQLAKMILFGLRLAVKEKEKVINEK